MYIFLNFLFFSLTTIYIKIVRLPSPYYKKYDTIFDMEMKPNNAYKHLAVCYIINVVNLLEYLYAFVGFISISNQPNAWSWII
jgi:hypothetical protein